MLYQGGNSPVVRQQAGVQLKNFLHTNDESLRAHYEERWLAMTPEIREYTKVNLVTYLLNKRIFISFSYKSNFSTIHFTINCMRDHNL